MQIKRTLAVAPLADVDLDDAEFRFGQLLLGVTYPPTLRQCAKGYQIVCGHDRLRSLHEKGIVEVEAFVLAAETTERQCVDYALAEHGQQGDRLVGQAAGSSPGARALDPVTRANFLKRLQALTSPEELRREYCPQLGLPPTAEAVERALNLLRLIPDLHNLLTAGRLHLKAAELLAMLDVADQAALAQLFDSCRLGQNLQRELVENLDDVARRDSKTIAELLQQTEVRSLLNDEEQAPAQKASSLRLVIHRWRFPEFSQREAEFAQGAAQLAWPPALKLSHHPTFEDSRLQVTMSFRSHEEFLALLTQLEKLRDREQLSALGLDD